MKKESGGGFIRHPHYPEIIKFKISSLKTNSTLSTSGCGDVDDLNNCEKLSLPGEQCCNYQDNLSNVGDNDKPGGCLSLSSNKKNNFNNNAQIWQSGLLPPVNHDNFDKMYFDMTEDVPQTSFDEEYHHLEIHSGSMTLQ